jgi:hypothetical protein
MKMNGLAGKQNGIIVSAARSCSFSVRPYIFVSIGAYKHLGIQGSEHQHLFSYQGASVTKNYQVSWNSWRIFFPGCNEPGTIITGYRPRSHGHVCHA